MSAILNDKTGYLIACAYKRPECAIGVIIGTGTNASYVEEIRYYAVYFKLLLCSCSGEI